jgi:ketosteroid isomerase-like protein
MTTEARAQAVLQAQLDRMNAFVAGDVAAVERLLAPEMTYTHTSARTDSRQDMIDSLVSGRLKYLSMEREAADVRFYGDTAVVTGRSRIHVASGGAEQRFGLLFLEVWAPRDGRWQSVAWQSTRLPG